MAPDHLRVTSGVSGTKAAEGFPVMRSSLARKAIAIIILLSQSFSVSILVSAQQKPEESRPRRTHDLAEPA
jgi:hypothetical protein